MKSLVIEGKNLINGKSIPYYRNVRNNQITLYMDVNAPKIGDIVRLKKILSTVTDQGYNLYLVLQSPYERRRNVGYMSYSVTLNGVNILEEDIANWGLPNSIIVYFKAQKTESILDIKVFSQKDCLPWNWGKASKLIVKDIELQKNSFSGNKFLVSTSSPFSKLNVE